MCKSDYNEQRGGAREIGARKGDSSRLADSALTKISQPSFLIHIDGSRSMAIPISPSSYYDERRINCQLLQSRTCLKAKVWYNSQVVRLSCYPCLDDCDRFLVPRIRTEANYVLSR